MKHSEHTLGARSCFIASFSDEQDLQKYLLENPSHLDVCRALVQPGAPGQIARVIATFPDTLAKQSREFSNMRLTLEAKDSYLKAFKASTKKERTRTLEANAAQAKRLQAEAEKAEQEKQAADAVKSAQTDLEWRRERWRVACSPEGRARALRIRLADRRREQGTSEHLWDMMSEEQQEDFDDALDEMLGKLNGDPDPEWNPDRETEKNVSTSSDVL